jgi:hypothetical protein
MVRTSTIFDFVGVEFCFYCRRYSTDILRVCMSVVALALPLNIHCAVLLNCYPIYRVHSKYKDNLAMNALVDINESGTALKALG